MIWTYQDVVEHLLDIFDLDGSERNYRQCRRAIDETYRELPQRARWVYFDKRYTIQTNAPYSTGTVSFDLTGGTYENQLTLSGGTWPSWAKSGLVLVNDLYHMIQERVSDTVLILKESTAPKADFTAQTYSIQRGQYDLPEDCRRVIRVYHQEDQCNVPIIQIDHTRDMNLVDNTTSTPWTASIHGSTETYGRQAVHFSPVPSESDHFDVWYEASPRTLRYFRESKGVVTNSSTTLTFTEAICEAGMVGAMIRFSANTTQEPTSTIGVRSDGSLYNPYKHEARIVRLASTTSLIIDTAPSTTLSGVKFVISDPVEIRQPSMWTAFLRGCEYSLARLISDKRLQERNAEYVQAIRFSMENDQPSVNSRSVAVVEVDPEVTTE